MLHATFEFFRSVFEVDLFTVLVVVGLGGVAYALVRFMTESLFLACAYTPFMLLGGLISNYVIGTKFAASLNDKDSDTVLMVGIGILITMVAMILLTRAVNALVEFRNPGGREGTNTMISARH